jgi:hypothetical protein
MRPESEMREWLRERKNLGIKSVHASFAGYGSVHDHWSRRVGDFDFLMNTLKIAADLGFRLEQRLFLTKGTLSLFEELIDKLDELPGKVKKREISSFFYGGRAGLLENERVTAADLERLPEKVSKLLLKRRPWRSEREWMDFVRQEDDVPTKVLVRLYPDDANIDQIEAKSCEAIIAELESRTRAAYALLPSRRELCEECGDVTNTQLYEHCPDIERKWLDRYLEKYPLKFERQLTYLAMNN